LYFLLSSPAASRSSHFYLSRVLGRRAQAGDVFRHFLTFASCLLDRVFLLNERTEPFDIRVHGEEIVSAIEQHGDGCILFGAHFGSFEVARAVGRRRKGGRELQISLLMYEENAKKIRAALAAINPRLATEVIGLGRLDSLIAVADRLQRGHFVGVLADRNVDGRNLVRFPFLGGEAAFPRGPFQVAMLLRRPVVLMVGLYRGGRSYDVIFEPLAEAAESRRDGEAWIEGAMRRYVERLEFYCREAPFNWFNFYDFWK
jgi:predicted LPLAT superfamily acyltransferase